MKRFGVFVGVAALVLAVWYLRRPRAATTPADVPPPAASPRAPNTASGAPTSPTSTAPARFRTVTRLADLEQRRELADRIASAQAARAATHAPARPTLPEADDTPISRTELRAAMHELIPHIKECYERALPSLASPDLEITAFLHLTGDPDIGTVVDADQLVDRVTGQPVEAGFDDCVRSTLQLMALPPLAEGDKLEVHYPFKFASK